MNTYYPKATHSSLTSWPATGASGYALGKLLPYLSCWELAENKNYQNKSKFVQIKLQWGKTSNGKDGPLLPVLETLL